MRFSRLFRRLFLVYAGLNLTLAFGFLVLIVSWQRNNGNEHVDNRLHLSAVALGVCLVSAGLAYVTAAKVVRPLTQLARRAKAFAASDEDHLLPVESQDEIGVLAAEFNAMKRQLARRVSQSRDNHQRLATVLSSMNEGIMAVDSDETILFANEASHRLLDFVTDDAVGRPLLEATRSQPLLEAVRQSLQNVRTWHTEFDSIGESRRALAVRVSCLPGDPCPGVVVVLHDVTELRRLENLRQEFVANVSHELKTPLAAIKAYAETLRLGAMNDIEHNIEFVARIEEQADRLHKLILDMLQIARIETGKETFAITDVSIAQTVDACLEQHSKAAEQKGITIHVERPDQPITVRVDEAGLRTIVDNLVDNAIKYTNEGGEVTLRWWAEESFANVEVRDTGIGIADKDHARVFERFFRVDGARSRELGGTGLGLSIVKHLSQAFDGLVVMRSQLGEGSSFQVRLPLQ